MPTNKSKIAPAPSRSSDVRKSDVSVARFMVAEEDGAAAAASEPPAIAPKPSAKPPASAPTTTATTMTAAAAVTQEEEGEGEDQGEDASAETPGPPGSTAGTSSPSLDRKDKGDKSGDKDAAVTIEDLALPKSIITRLAKGVLPPNTQIQANAILALTKSATVFINHLANAYVYIFKTVFSFCKRLTEFNSFFCLLVVCYCTVQTNTRYLQTRKQSCPQTSSKDSSQSSLISCGIDSKLNLPVC